MLLPVSLFSDIVILSGIPSGMSGTGRCISFLEKSVSNLRIRVGIVARPEAVYRPVITLNISTFGKQLVAYLAYGLKHLYFLAEVAILLRLRGKELIILHPQNLGYELSIKIIRSRVLPPVLYLLDNSFFCISSYNYLDRTGQACTLCSDFDEYQAVLNGCRPFPTLDWNAIEYVQVLKSLVRTNKIKLAAQSQNQAELARLHFKTKNLPDVVGLWTDDWTSSTRYPVCHVKAAGESAIFKWDVVFHGHALNAKGFRWMMQLAQKCPSIKFMFPFDGLAHPNAPPNCYFVPCTWETGLKEHIQSSLFVAVPSMWSAPIEGALVKSLFFGRAVLVVDVDTTYANTLPDNLVYKLPLDICSASTSIKDLCRERWAPDANTRSEWLAEFQHNEVSFVPRLIEVALSR